MGIFSIDASWRQTVALGLLLGATFCFTRLISSIVATREAGVGRWENLRLGTALAAALFIVHPYLGSGRIGAGDANSYSLAIADFLAQRHAGIFPVLIGQSPFAFSGGFQPLRNAPWLVHLAWLLNSLTLGTLGVSELLNLTVVASMVAGVLGCYAALRLTLPRAPLPALGLAVLYGMCPGILAPLYEGDMYPTFMTLPFLPWLVFGIAQSAESPNRIGPWSVQAAALAGLWLAHPPVAAWATFLAALASMAVLARERSVRVIRAALPAVFIFTALSGYLFVSVRSLGLPPVSGADAVASVGFKIETLRAGWLPSFRPMSRNADNILGDIQLGYGLWACVLLSAASAAATKSGRSLLGCFAIVLLFAWPLPVLTPWVWRHLPAELLLVTNQWPAERFYVILATLAVFIAAAAMGRPLQQTRRGRVAVAALLAASCLWGALEARKLFRRAAATRLSGAASEAFLLAENITVSRTHSYEYLGTPSYFSNGHMDPRLETRLLDRDTRLPFADGSTLRADLPPSAVGPQILTFQAGSDGTFAQAFPLGPGQSRLLRLDFMGQNPAGELQALGGQLYDFYELPQSGSPKAFGSGPEASHALILQNSTLVPETVTLRFIGHAAPGPFARVSIEPLAEDERIIKLESLTPFYAVVTAPRAGYLETPKLFVPGYRAVVDGVATPIRRSAEGLVAISLGAGRHDVVLSYVGSSLLRGSYYVTAAAWILFFAGACVVMLGKRGLLVPMGASAAALFAGSVGRRPSSWPLWLLGTASAAGIAMIFARPRGKLGPFSGVVTMELRLPWPPIGHTEPLLTTGHTGAGDFIYVTYVDGSHVVVGHDKWAYGGGRSSPIAVDFEKPQTVEIGIASLAPEASAEAGRLTPGISPAVTKRKVFVIWNGVPVYGDDEVAYPSTPGEITFGENRIGGSSAEAHFSGEILHVEPSTHP